LFCERIICISIISYGKIHFDIRVFWITNTFLERIMLAIHDSTVYSYLATLVFCGVKVTVMLMGPASYSVITLCCYVHEVFLLCLMSGYLAS